MRNKKDWIGFKCETCDQRLTEEYMKEPLYNLNSCHETLSGAKIWYCGQCNLDEQIRLKKEAQEEKPKGNIYGKAHKNKT